MYFVNARVSQKFNSFCFEKFILKQKHQDIVECKFAFV